MRVTVLFCSALRRPDLGCFLGTTVHCMGYWKEFILSGSVWDLELSQVLWPATLKMQVRPSDTWGPDMFSVHWGTLHVPQWAPHRPCVSLDILEVWGVWIEHPQAWQCLTYNQTHQIVHQEEFVFYEHLVSTDFLFLFFLKIKLIDSSRSFATSTASVDVMDYLYQQEPHRLVRMVAKGSENEIEKSTLCF